MPVLTRPKRMHSTFGGQCSDSEYPRATSPAHIRTSEQDSDHAFMPQRDVYTANSLVLPAARVECDRVERGRHAPKIALSRRHAARPSLDHHRGLRS